MRGVFVCGGAPCNKRPVAPAPRAGGLLVWAQATTHMGAPTGTHAPSSRAAATRAAKAGSALTPVVPLHAADVH